MALHPCMMIGFGIALVGFIGVFAIMARHGGMAFGFEAWKRMGRFLRDPATKGPRRLFFAFAAVLGLGFALMLAGVLIVDGRQRSACRKQCESAGFEDGLVRGDPHAERPGETERLCWCRNGEQWADRPIAAPSP
jgi:hypothetical protein